MSLSTEQRFSIPVDISSSAESSVRDFIHLLKPGVMSLVVFTGFVGMMMAPSHSHPFTCFVVLLSIALGSGASGAINMWYDRDIDRIMTRTRNRPIPSGRLSPEAALQFGVLLAGLSLILLYLASNLLAASLLAFSIFFYVVIYTIWLKRATPQNIVIGGLAGSFPPLIGWVAMTNSLAVEPFLLVAIIFVWTPPHFWALSLYRSQDYAKAGIPMLPVVAGIQTTKTYIFWYSCALLVAALLPLIYPMAGNIYGGIACGLTLVFLVLSWRTYTSSDPTPARQLFGYSILYLFLLYMGFVMDKLLS